MIQSYEYFSDGLKPPTVDLWTFGVDLEKQWTSGGDLRKPVSQRQRALHTARVCYRSEENSARQSAWERKNHGERPIFTIIIVTWNHDIVFLKQVTLVCLVGVFLRIRSHGIHHHEQPPCGMIFLDHFFPTTK